MVVLDLIKGSLRLVGAFATGETPEAAEAQDALDILNQLMESLSIDGLDVWDQSTQTFSLVASQSVYTIGASGNFNTVKPIRIRDAYIVSNNITFPLNIISQEFYDQIGYKTLSTPYPAYLVYTNTPTSLGSITIWPVPNTIYPLTLNIDAQFTPFTNTAQTITWPAGIARMVRYLLALDLWDEYNETPPPPNLVRTAMDAKSKIEALNSGNNNSPITYDSTLTRVGSFNKLATGIAGGPV
jgi:hypothetical protein